MQSAGKGFVKKSVSVEELPMEGGARIRWLITHRDGAQTFSMRLVEVKEGDNTPYHTHDYEHEIYVVDGKAEATMGDKKQTISADDVIYIPPNVYHGMKALEDLKIVCVVPIRVAKELLGE